ncbi:MAG: hypothetical protein QM676_04240 [Novosphingobium sp.]
MTGKSDDAAAPSPARPVHTAKLVVEATKAFPKDGIMVRDVLWNRNLGHLGMKKLGRFERIALAKHRGVSLLAPFSKTSYERDILMI